MAQKKPREQYRAERKRKANRMSRIGNHARSAARLFDELMVKKKKGEDHG